MLSCLSPITKYTKSLIPTHLPYNLNKKNSFDKVINFIIDKKINESEINESEYKSRCDELLKYCLSKMLNVELNLSPDIEPSSLENASSTNESTSSSKANSTSSSKKSSENFLNELNAIKTEINILSSHSSTISAISESWFNGHYTRGLHKILAAIFIAERGSDAFFKSNKPNDPSHLNHLQFSFWINSKVKNFPEFSRHNLINAKFNTAYFQDIKQLNEQVSFGTGDYDLKSSLNALLHKTIPNNVPVVTPSPEIDSSSQTKHVPYVSVEQNSLTKLNPASASASANEDGSVPKLKQLVSIIEKATPKERNLYLQYCLGVKFEKGYTCFGYVSREIGKLKNIIEDRSIPYIQDYAIALFYIFEKGIKAFQEDAKLSNLGFEIWLSNQIQDWDQVYIARKTKIGVEQDHKYGIVISNIEIDNSSQVIINNISIFTMPACPQIREVASSHSPVSSSSSFSLGDIERQKDTSTIQKFNTHDFWNFLQQCTKLEKENLIQYCLGLIYSKNLGQVLIDRKVAEYIESFFSKSDDILELSTGDILNLHKFLILEIFYSLNNKNAFLNEVEQSSFSVTNLFGWLKKYWQIDLQPANKDKPEKFNFKGFYVWLSKQIDLWNTNNPSQIINHAFISEYEYFYKNIKRDGGSTEYNGVDILKFESHLKVIPCPNNHEGVPTNE